jgi:hypothetical protein
MKEYMKESTVSIKSDNWRHSNNNNRTINIATMIIDAWEVAKGEPVHTEYGGLITDIKQIPKYENN